MRKAWYKKYKDLGDGAVSLIDGSEVMGKVIASDDPRITLLVRKYKDGTSDRVRITAHSNGVFDYQVADKDRWGAAKEFIGDPDWHPPRVQSNTIPGTSPSSIENYDVNTGRVYEGGRPELREVYREMGLQLISAAEQRNMSNRDRTPVKADGSIVHDRFTGSRPNAPEGAIESVYVDSKNLEPWRD